MSVPAAVEPHTIIRGVLGQWLMTIVAAAIGAGVATGFTFRTSRSLERRQRADESALALLVACDRAAHLIGRGVAEPDMTQQERSAHYWLLDYEIAPLGRALELAAIRQPTVDAANDMVNSLREFRRAVAFRSGEPNAVPYSLEEDSVYLTNLRPYWQKRDDFINAARRERGLRAATVERIVVRRDVGSSPIEDAPGLNNRRR